MKYSKLLITIVILITAFSASAQKRKTTLPPQPSKIEDLPKRPVDTIKTADPETKVIIYSNNTWEFYRPNISNRLADHDAYKFNWETESIFAYRNISFDDIPQRIQLQLTDSLITYSRPAAGRVLSKFGMRKRTRHNGVDIPLKVGEPILATFDGKVRYAKWNPGGYGYLVILRHPNGLETWYAHQSRINVNQDDYVKAGQIIGFAGNTGRSRGSHLHYETRYKDQAFDPEFIIDFETGQIRNNKFTLEKRFLNIKSRASEMLEEEDEEDSEMPGSLLSDASDSTVINVQKPKPAPKPQQAATYHTIRSGDTLGALAMKYGVTIDQICRLNNIKRTTTLTLNRNIRIK